MKNLFGVIAVTTVVIASIVGWILNVIAIFGSSFDPLTGVVVLRCIGVFVPPIGAVMGYI